MHRHPDELDELDRDDEPDITVRVHAAAFYLALIKAGLYDEAAEFAAWYLETFDHDLET